MVTYDPALTSLKGLRLSLCVLSTLIRVVPCAGTVGVLVEVDTATTHFHTGAAISLCLPILAERS